MARLTLKLSESQIEQLKSNARMAGMTLSAFLYQTGIKNVKVTIPDDNMIEKIVEAKANEIASDPKFMKRIYEGIFKHAKKASKTSCYRTRAS